MIEFTTQHAADQEDTTFMLQPKNTIEDERVVTLRYTWLKYTDTRRPQGDTKIKKYWVWRSDKKCIEKVSYDKEWGGFYSHGDSIQRSPQHIIANFTDSRVTHWMEYFEPILQPREGE